MDRVRLAPPPAAPRCRGRGGGRCRGAADPLPLRRAPRAPGRACPWRGPGGVHHHARGLVHHEQVVVLVTRPRRARPHRRRDRREPPAPRCVPPRARPGSAGGSSVAPARRRSPRPRRSAAAPSRATPPPPRPPGGRRDARRRPPLRRSKAIRSISRSWRRSRSPIAGPAPRRTMQVSATLNAGQAIGSMKSVTAPSRARSSRLPSAPPSSIPTGSHRHGVCASAHEVADEQRERHADQDRHDRRRRPRAPRRRRPCCACW